MTLTAKPQKGRPKLAQKRKRDWRERDHIQQAIERGHIADIRADLDTQPTLPDSEEKDPLYNRGFYSIKLSKASAAKLKKAAEHEVISEQWYDFQHNLNEPDYEQTIDDVPQATFAMQDAFVEVLKMQPLQIAIVILDVDSGADFEEFASTFLDYPPGADHDIGKDAFLRDGIMTTCGVMRKWSFLKTVQRLRDDEGHFSPATTPTELAEDGTEIIVEGRWKDRLVDDIIEQYPDEYPCMVLFSRKIIYGASLVFVQGDDEPGDNTLLGQTMTAVDAAEFDPRVAFWLAQNALRPTDGWLSLTIPRSAIQGWIDDSIAHIDPPGAGGGDPEDPFDPGNGQGGGNGGDPPPIDPTDPPPGTNPPPGEGGTGTVPPPGEGGDRLTFDCETDILYHEEGTNHVYSFADFSLNQNGGWLLTLGLQAFIPVNAQDVQANLDEAIATAVEAKRIAESKSAFYEIRRVVLCFTFQRMRRVGFLVDGEDSFATLDMDRVVGTPFSGGLTDPRPILYKNRSGAVTQQQVRGEIKSFNPWNFEAGGFEAQAVAQVEIAEDVKAVITNYQTITDLEFDCVCVPAAWDFFVSHSDIPIVKIGLESADIYYKVSNWTGHFKFDTRVANLHENPHESGSTLWFSDVPDGLTTGSAVTGSAFNQIATPNAYTGTHASIILNDGSGGNHSELDLLSKATGYDAGCDAAYTTAELTIAYVGGAQDITLHVRRTPGGAGETFTASLPDNYNGSASNPTNQLQTVTRTFDISSVGLLLGDTLHNVSLTAPGIYVAEWRLHLS